MTYHQSNLRNCYYSWLNKNVRILLQLITAKLNSPQKVRVAQKVRVSRLAGKSLKGGRNASGLSVKLLLKTRQQNSEVNEKCHLSLVSSNTCLLYRFRNESASLIDYIPFDMPLSSHPRSRKSAQAWCETFIMSG